MQRALGVKFFPICLHDLDEYLPFRRGLLSQRVAHDGKSIFRDPCQVEEWRNEGRRSLGPKLALGSNELPGLAPHLELVDMCPDPARIAPAEAFSTIPD
jgi:hypothetical protein